MKWIKKETQDRMLWCLLGVILLLTFLTYCYTDLLLIIRHSFGIYDTIRMGKPFSFYSYSTAKVLGESFPIAGEVPYDFWVYIPIALWNLPTYLWECVTKQTFEANLLAIWWGKAMLLLPIGGCIYAIQDMVRFGLKKEKGGQVAVFLFLSSMCFIQGTGMLAQIDIMNLCFTLLGIAAMVKGKNRWFYIWFACACTCKMLGLFVAIPLILYKEKRIFYIIRDLFLVSSLTLLSKILFYVDKMKCPTTFDEIRFSEYLYTSNLNMGRGPIYLFFVAFLAVLIFAYWLEWKEEPSMYRTQMCLWLAYAGISSFFLFSNTQAYWIVLLAPYAAILGVNNERHSKLVIILDSVVGAAALGVSMLTFPGFFTEMMNLNFGMMSRIAGPLQCTKVTDFVLAHGFDPSRLAMICNSFFTVALISLLVILRPQAKNNGNSKISVDREALWLRIAINVACILIPIILIFK